MHNIHNGFTVFEVDVLKIKDSIVLAHDNMEEIYGLSSNFKDVELKDFTKLKVYNKYTPTTIVMLKDIIDRYPNTRFILDIKEQDSDYVDVLKYINTVFNNTTNLIVQVYCEQDIVACVDLGYRSCILGLWKNFDDIFDLECLKFIDCVKFKNIDVFGVAISYDHIFDSRFENFMDGLEYDAYFHGDLIKKMDEKEIRESNKFGMYFFI